MHQIIKKAALFAATGIAVATLMPAAASAATQIDFTGSNTNSSNSAGNVRTFTFGTLKVEVTGWTLKADGTVAKSYVGQYDGLGLGITDPYENGNNNTHTVDSQGTIDFLVFQFSSNVVVSSAYLTPFSVGGTTDSDATVAAGWTNVPLSGALNFTNWNSVGLTFQNMQYSQGDSSASWQPVNADGDGGSLFLIGAGTVPKPDGSIDGFKVRSLLETPAVPEPATWAMMIAGIGAVGVSMRRRKTAVSFA